MLASHLHAAKRQRVQLMHQVAVKQAVAPDAPPTHVARQVINLQGQGGHTDTGQGRAGQDRTGQDSGSSSFMPRADEYR